MAFGIGVVAPAAAQEPAIKVTLLGTGCPPAVMNRFGPSTLVEAGTQKFLFDAGRGAMQRLTQLGVPWNDVQGVFLTHLHSDHVVGFPDVWLTGWLIAPGRNVPLRVWGPTGTSAMMSHLEQAYAYDVGLRIKNDRASAEGVMLRSQDVGEGPVWDQGGVKVSAFDVDHGPAKPALGYRIDYAGRSVVLSGDTRKSDNLIRQAQGVDLLVHEVFVPDTLRRAGVPPERAKSIVDYHLTPGEAGESVCPGEAQARGLFAHLHADGPGARSAFTDSPHIQRTPGAGPGSDGDRSRRQDRRSTAWRFFAMIDPPFL